MDVVSLDSFYPLLDTSFPGEIRGDLAIGKIKNIKVFRFCGIPCKINVSCIPHNTYKVRQNGSQNESPLLNLATMLSFLCR